MAMYFQCGEQYRRAYILKDKQPPGVAMVRGTGVHKAVETNFSQKIDTHEDLPIPDIQAAAAAGVSAAIEAEGLLLTPDEQARGAAKVKGEITDRAVALAGMFGRQVAPAIQPILVEQFVRIELPNHSHDLNGRLDVADFHDRIRDVKTANRRKNQADVDRSDQLSYYHAAFKQVTGRRAQGVILDVLVDKRTPEVQRLEARRDEADMKVFVNRLNAMLAGVAAGSFPPAPVGSWCCSPRFCGYWWTCPYVNSERAAAAEENS